MARNLARSFALPSVLAILVGGALVATPALPANAAGSEITVCASGCDHVAIQGAVDAAVSGDTINVGPGVFVGDVVVDKALTLQGANVGLDANGAGRGDESVVDGAFTLTAGGVGIDGFTVQGAGAGVTSNGSSAVSDITVTNNIFAGNTGKQTISHWGPAQPVENWTISNNRITDIRNTDATAITIFNVTGLEISGNTIHHSNENYSGRRGINVDGGINVSITGNDIDMGVTDPGADYLATFNAARYPIQISASAGLTEGVVVAHNVLAGAYDGIVTLGNGDYVDVQIVGNTIDRVYFGIRPQAGTLTGAGEQRDFDIRNNAITSASSAIRIAAGVTGGATPDPYNNLTFSENSLVAPEPVVFVEDGTQLNPSDNLIDFTDNWWGDASGPGTARISAPDDTFDASSWISWYADDPEKADEPGFWPVDRGQEIVVPVGDDVTVDVPNTRTRTTVTVDSVSSNGGSASIVLTPMSAAELPVSSAGFDVGSATLFDISVHVVGDVTVTGPYTICLEAEPDTRLWHYENNTWVDMTGRVIPANGTLEVPTGFVCGMTPTLSPFALVGALSELAATGVGPVSQWGLFAALLLVTGVAVSLISRRVRIQARSQH